MAADRTQILGQSTAHFGAATEIPQRLRLIEFCVEVLIRQSRIGKTWVEGFERTTSFLETLPLASDEFNLARLRLKNALEYCQRGEFGPAAIELRLVRGGLRKLKRCSQLADKPLKNRSFEDPMSHTMNALPRP